MPRPTRSSPRIAHLAVVLALSPALACGSESVVPTGAGPGPEPSAGTIEATSATTGEDPDPDGYTLTLDGGEGRGIAPDGTVTFDGVEEGDHELTLSGAARNCRVDGANPTRLTDDSGKDLAPRWAP